MRWKALSLTLALTLAMSGCVTTLGYYQDSLKSKQVKEAVDWVPEYDVVKHWAYDVHDGLDARATINHYALEYGALLGLAAAGAMAGLAVFDGSSAALKGIPIGAAFLSGAAAYYDNHFRYDMYSRASSYVRALIDVSDERVTWLRGNNSTVSPLVHPKIDTEARCLKAEVGRVIDLVKRHVALADPNNLAAELRTITASVDQGKIADLVKAAQGDLSDLNVPANLRETFCQGTGLLPGPLEDPRLLVNSTQAVLMSLAENRVALDSAITNGQAQHDRLSSQADDLAKTKPAASVKPARDRIDDLQNVLHAAGPVLTSAKAVSATTAAGYIATINNPATEAATKLDTAAKLFGERETIRSQDQAVVAAAAGITTALRTAQDAIQAVK